jgi:hypothetical protein
MPPGNASKPAVTVLFLLAMLGKSQSNLLWGDPMLVDPTHFQLQLYADFSSLPDNPKAFHLNLTPGTNGFPAGLYVTTDLLRSTQLLRVTGPNDVTVFKDGLDNLEATLFATGAYGTGMFISEPTNLQILRLLADGSVTTFANVGTNPFGPAGMAYAPDGTLLVTDFTGRSILQVSPTGSSSVFASFSGPASMKALLALDPGTANRFGAPLLAGTFSSMNDTIFGVSADGKTITPIASGFTFLEFLTSGPGGAFGDNIFVSEFGPDVVGSGRVSILAPDGTVTPFLTGLNAADVAFDTTGILGGGMFVSDMNGDGDLAGRIWRVTPIPEPSSLLLLGPSILALAWFAGRRLSRP